MLLNHDKTTQLNHKKVDQRIQNKIHKGSHCENQESKRITTSNLQILTNSSSPTQETKSSKSWSTQLMKKKCMDGGLAQELVRFNVKTY